MKTGAVKYRYWLPAALLSALAVWICYTSLLAFWVGDDLDYMFRVNNAIWSSGGKIGSAYDLFSSMYFHYLHVNGRYVAHFLVQLFCGVLGQTAFAVCNALVWPLLAVLIAKVSGVEWGSPRVMTGIVLMSLLGFVTKMMPTCQIGFVWMMALTLGWITAFKCLKQKQLSRWWLPLPFFFSMLAGNGQEALNIGVAAALGLYCCRKRFRLTGVEWVMIIGFVAGLAFLCFSPAVAGRVDHTAIPLHRSLLNMVLCLPIFWAMCLLLIWKLATHRLSAREIWTDNRYCLVAICVLLLFNLYVGVYCNRQLFGIELLSMIVVLRTVQQGKISWVWIGAMTILAAVMMSYQIAWLKDSRQQLQDLEQIFAESEKSQVCYDRHRSTTSYYGLMAHYHETAVAYGNADIPHSFCKYLKSKYPDREYPTLRPARFAKTLKTSELDSVEEYYPGHYLVLTDTVGTHSVVVTEELNLPYLSVGRRERIQPLDFNYTKKTNFRTYLVVPQDPFYRILDVKLIEKP